MGKFTEALKKAAEKRIERLEKQEEVKPYVIRAASDSKIDPHVVSYFDPSSPVAEQYRILRTNLQALDKSNPPRMLAITSAIHGEGKTITAINLAVTFAHDLNKKSILLVDADLRKGTLTKDLGLKAEKGFSDILSNGAKPDESLLSIGIDNLHILPSGSRPHNPAELLGSQRARQLLAEFKAQYDYVIFDCPPVVPVTDAGVLGPLCDGVLMVLQAGRTQRGVVVHAQDRLQAVRARVLGYVMTNIEYHIPEYIYRYL
ncbi:MAG: CpsD/CapB family tyrosine-protein kinase [Candidatus Omnitrophica bacterium]|nr:CpsD/CapB family tyrosine-protein kinase [Candidatus Omnitrophota bacterium]MDD5574778.1 CpsD/CapB family tyrosine-protein kinase [Candidatus Omnitrophota bacterium]